VAEPVTPLSHLRVLDMSRLMPGGYCTVLLADLGAEVVKVEAPGKGDGLRPVGPHSQTEPMHFALNRGKRSITLDIRNPAAAPVLRKLVTRFDVVVESQKPGSLDAAGMGYDALREENPGLIWCSISGFGTSGPYVDAPGHDLTYMGVAGMLAQIGNGAGYPVPDGVIGIPFASLVSAVGILSALAQRERTGEGARIDTSITDSITWALSDQFATQVSSGGARFPAMACRQNYRCADDRWVTVTAAEPRSWAKLMEAMGEPDLVDQLYGPDQPALIATLTEKFASRPSTEWRANPGFAGGVGPVLDMTEVVDDEHAVATDSILHAEDELGRPVPGNPVRFNGLSGADAATARTAPSDLGADTDAVLASAGLSTDQIESLRRDGVI
jgi:crotonobetainyl-CoA:carnitine CoA-transferase CaiB-like acyl-CoA transferase